MRHNCCTSIAGAICMICTICAKCAWQAHICKRCVQGKAQGITRFIVALRNPNDRGKKFVTFARVYTGLAVRTLLPYSEAIMMTCE